MPEYVTLGNCGCPCGPVPCITSSSYTLEAPIECGRAPFTTGGMDGVYRVHRVAWTNQHGSFVRTNTYSSGSATTCEVTTTETEGAVFEPASSGGSSSVSITELTPIHKVTVYSNFSGFPFQTVTEDLSDFTDQFLPTRQFAMLESKAFNYPLDDLAVGEHRRIQLDYDGNECEREPRVLYPIRDGALYEDRFSGAAYRKSRVFVSVELNQETCCHCEFDEAFDVFGISMKTPACYRTNHRRVGAEIVCDPIPEPLVLDILPLHVEGALYERVVRQVGFETPPCCVT